MKRIFRIIGWALLGFLLLLGGIFAFLNSPTGQDFLTKQVVSYLRTKLHTKIEVEKVRFDIPDWISLENVYLEDLQHDTLLAGKRLYLDMDMMALLQNKVAINQVELENIRVKIKRTLPDTTFNFNFILQAFSSTETQKNTTSSPLDINLKNIKVSHAKITYQDAILGTVADADLGFLETTFDKFNPNKSQYHFAKIDSKNSAISLNLFKPLRPSSNDNLANKNATDTLDFNLKKISLSNLNWAFESAEDGIKNHVKLGKFEAEGQSFFLEKQQISIKSVLLENTKSDVEIVKNTQKTSNSDNKPSNWNIEIKEIQTKNNDIRYDDFNAVSLQNGLDASHLNLKNLSLNLDNFSFNPKQISGNLKQLNFVEKSGLNIQNISTNFSYSDKQISLKKLIIKTPNTLLQDELSLSYNSIEDFSKNLGSVGLKISLKKSTLAFKDLLIFIPDLAKNPALKGHENDIVKADGILNGTVNNLSIPSLNIEGFGKTQLQVSGRILGLPNTEKLALNLTIGQLNANKKDILGMVGDSLIPKNIDLPENLNLEGSIKGKLQDLVIDAAVDSEFGGASFKGNLVNITADKNLGGVPRYDGRITLQDFDLGRLTKQQEKVGKLTLEADIHGVGFDTKTMNATIVGTAQKAAINGYEYSNLALNGSINDQIATFDASINDQNSKIKVVGKANLADKFPAIKADVSIDELDLKKLNFYAENLSLKGDIQLNLTSTDPENPLGEIKINRAVVQKDGKRIPLDKVSLNFKNIGQGSADNQRDIVLKSPFLNAKIKGKFIYVEIADILFTEINKYFVLPAYPYKSISNGYNLSIEATLNNHPIIQSFVPEITKLDTVRLSAKLNSEADTTLQTSVFIPFMEYDTSTVKNARFNIFGLKNKAHYAGNIEQMIYSDYRIKRASVTGEIANNMLSLALLVKDSLNINRYGLAGNLRSIDDKFRLNFNKNGTLIDYKAWQTDSTGFIDYSSKGLIINNLALTQNRQRVVINSQTPEPNSPLQIQIDSLNIKPFVVLAVQDSTLAAGTLNGTFKLSNYMSQPEFTGDLAIKNFIFTQIPIGNLSINAANETANKINVKATLLDNNNDIRLGGNYLLNNKNPLDFKIDIQKLGAKTVEAFSFGQLKNAKGNLQGNLFLNGEPSKPTIDGEVKFDTVSFSLAQLGAKYRIQNQKMAFKNSIITFDKFGITDSLGQNLLVNGTLSLQKIPDFSYKLDIDTKNFMVLNGSRTDNDFFYGKGFVDAHLNIKGIGTKPAIEGNIKVKNGSNITVIMPDREIDKAETDGIVEFINPDDNNITENDSAGVTKTYNFVEEMSLNIEVDDKSELTVVIDELNGDNLKVKGNAQLNTGITPSGQLYIFGLYDLTSGKYDLSFQFLKKQFTIEKGSNLLWTGEPMQAQININAIYPIETELTALREDAAKYKKVPLEVVLKMSGNLANPQIDFDIRIDKNKAAKEDITQIENSGILSNLKTNQVELNKQIFALLVLNRFLGEQSSNFFSSFNPEAIARQSVSKLLSDQLNLLAGDLIKGVKLDFNLQSTSETTDKGSAAQTDLNIGISKAFLDNRLTIAVGRNFQLENTTGTDKSSNEIVDNISINYNLSKDGRYAARAYRKNQAIIDGFIVETGVSCAITMEYARFKELFQKKR